MKWQTPGAFTGFDRGTEAEWGDVHNLGDYQQLCTAVDQSRLSGLLDAMNGGERLRKALKSCIGNYCGRHKRYTSRKLRVRFGDDDGYDGKSTIKTVRGALYDNISNFFIPFVDIFVVDNYPECAISVVRSVVSWCNDTDSGSRKEMDRLFERIVMPELGIKFCSGHRPLALFREIPEVWDLVDVMVFQFKVSDPGSVGGLSILLENM